MQGKLNLGETKFHPSNLNFMFVNLYLFLLVIVMTLLLHYYIITLSVYSIIIILIYEELSRNEFGLQK